MLLTCVPPQSSVEKSEIPSTRTSSPYFSSNRARARAVFFRLFYRHDARRDGAVSQHLLVDDALRLAQLVEADGREVVEVEAQEGRRDERACLADVLAEHARERLVQKVRRGVVTLDVGAAHGVYLRRHAVAGLYSSLGHFSFMYYEVGDGVNGVGDFKFHAVRVNLSGVSDRVRPSLRRTECSKARARLPVPSQASSARAPFIMTALTSASHFVSV